MRRDRASIEQGMRKICPFSPIVYPYFRHTHEYGTKQLRSNIEAAKKLGKGCQQFFFTCFLHECTPTFAGVQSNKCWSAGQQTADVFCLLLETPIYTASPTTNKKTRSATKKYSRRIQGIQRLNIPSAEFVISNSYFCNHTREQLQRRENISCH